MCNVNSLNLQMKFCFNGRHIDSLLKWMLLMILMVEYQTVWALQCVTSTQAGPPLPNLPDSYQVSVECNMLDKGYTSSAKIYYDSLGNRATMKYFANGIDRSFIFSYATDEIFSISNSYCTVSNLTASNITSFFGETYSHGVPHIDPVQDSLKFGKKYGEVYIGNDTIRGVPVNHWQACTNFSQWSTLSIDYYFSANWSTASTFSSVPMRAEVRAQSTLSNGSTYLLHHIYDYFDFMPDIEVDEAIFQTPIGVVCPGRKFSKKLPTMPRNFYYRVEKVFTDLSAIVFEDIWYDESFQFYRIDYRPLAPEEPINTVNPTTEIHDYNTGVRYIIDQSTKDCKVVALNNYTMDAAQNLTARKVNGSFMLDMRNPLQLFNLDSNYTYVGQTYTRNILCDVYIARRGDLFIDGFVSFTNLTITYYFLAEEWTDVADHLAESTETIKGKYGTPIQMDLLADDTGLSMSYNFLDFNPESPDLNVFDISQCYPEANKLTFQVTFPGVLNPNTGPVLVEWAHLIFAKTMGVSNIRVSNVRLDNDDGGIYIKATLLDKILPTAEFTYIPNKSGVISNTLPPMECAKFCVNNDNIRCESFDSCDDGTCRLSTTPLSGDQIPNNSTKCRHFARTVRPLKPEMSILDAFTRLRISVYNRTLELTPMLQKTYTAIDVKLIFGWLNSRVVVPTFPSQFSYKVQVTIPSTKHVYSTSVWYDSGFKMIRYDPHVNKVLAPFYSTNPLKVIEDFKTGIQYVIDKTYQNCTVSQLTGNAASAYLSPNTTQNATWDITMKDPYTTFRIDKTYKFVGQQTIRGMTCKLFESLRTDYRLPGNPYPLTAVLRYAFLSDKWSETSDNYLGSVGQPIRLDVLVLDTSFYMQFNFYDFDNDHPDTSVFDIHECNKEGKWKHFTVQFPGPFHPYVDTSSRMFKLEGLFGMSSKTNVSNIRFQRLRLDHDAVNIYLSATLADREKTSLYFTKVPIDYVPQHADKVLSIAQEDACADACIQDTTIKCNSFYFCQTTRQCLLSVNHVPEGPGTIKLSDCSSYSRTVEDLGIPISNTYAFTLLKNQIYTGNFTIIIPIPGTDQSKTYTAVGIKEEFTNTVSRSAEESALLEFTRLSDHASLQPDSVDILKFIAMDDCALACKEKAACNAFSYSLDKQTCFTVSGFKKGDMSNVVNTTKPNYLYMRKYSKMYTVNPGVTSQAIADSVIGSVSSDDDCGRLCSLTTNFTCRVFQYCANTRQCLLIKDRMLRYAVQPSSKEASTCYQYTSKTILDFKAVNAGKYHFTNVLNIQMVSLAECADICLQELGNNCKGFYYAAPSLTCYLTAAADNSSQDATSVFCDVYKRTYFPPVTSSNIVTSVTSNIVMTSSSTSSNKKTSSVTCVPPLTSTQNILSSSVGSVSGMTSTVNAINTASPQTENKISGVKSGLVVGIAFIMFVVGLVVGAIILHSYRLYRGKDEMKTNFIEHEEI